MITIRQATSSDEIGTAIDIQLRVFAREQGIPEEDCHSGNEKAVHLLALDDDTIVATARLRIMDDGVAEVARIAVLPQSRSSGLGKRLVTELETIAIEAGVAQLVLYPHAYLETFYTRLGYSKTDETTPAAGGHELITMRKSIAHLSSRNEKEA